MVGSLLMTGDFTVHGGSPGASDVLIIDGTGIAETVEIAPSTTDPDVVVVTRNGVSMEETGFEIIKVIETSDNDTLIVDPGLGDSVGKVEDSPQENTDRYVSNTLPEIQFTGLNIFRIDPSGDGTNVVTFATENLIGASNYETDLGTFDTLIIEGSAKDDTYTVTNPGGAPIAAISHVGGATVTEIAGVLAGWKSGTLGGDDTVSIVGTLPDVNSIKVDGGDPTASDVVEYVSTQGSADFTVTPGSTPDSGVVTMDGQEFEFDAVEIVRLDAGGGGSTDTVEVLGTGANNQITFVGSTTDSDEATIYVDNRAVIEVENFTNNGSSNVYLDGQAGDDQFSFTLNVAVAFDDVFIIGGDPSASDTVIINASATPATRFW